MTAKSRLIIAIAGVVAASSVVALTWVHINTGRIEGTVYFTAGGGAAPPAGSTRPSPLPVNGAIVVAVPGQTARWMVRDGRYAVAEPISGSATSVHADNSGRYQIDLSPGIYAIGALAENWQAPEINGHPSLPLTAPSQFRPVRIDRGESLDWDILIDFEAP